VLTKLPDHITGEFKMAADWNNLQDTERKMYQSLRDAGRLIPLSPEDVERSEAQFHEASIVLSPQLADPCEVLARIRSHERQHSTGNKPQVFGRLIQMLRKDKGLSVSELASKARIDEQELLRIEAEIDHEPKPRTVSQLAEIFGVVPKSLARVANLTRHVDEQIVEGVVKFAACAKDIEKLSQEEKRALRDFVKLLNSMK
jgi:transcriptional regulator with XRE-family HTH domain